MVCPPPKKKEVKKGEEFVREAENFHVRVRLIRFAPKINTVACITVGVVADKYGLHVCQNGSGCRVGLRRLLPRADYISAATKRERGAKMGWAQSEVKAPHGNRVSGGVKKKY